MLNRIFPATALSLGALVALVACSTGDGLVAPPPPSSDQTPFFDDQRPLPPEEDLPPLTKEQLCIELCAAAERCLPPDVDCFSACQSPEALESFSIEACLGQSVDQGPRPEPDPVPVPEPDPVPMDAGTGGAGDAGTEGGGTCSPATSCTCADACETCLCFTGGDMAACVMQQACPAS